MGEKKRALAQKVKSDRVTDCLLEMWSLNLNRLTMTSFQGVVSINAAVDKLQFKDRVSQCPDLPAALCSPLSPQLITKGHSRALPSKENSEIKNQPGLHWLGPLEIIIIISSGKRNNNLCSLRHELLSTPFFYFTVIWGSHTFLLNCFSVDCMFLSNGCRKYC